MLAVAGLHYSRHQKTASQTPIAFAKFRLIGKGTDPSGNPPLPIPEWPSW